LHKLSTGYWTRRRWPVQLSREAEKKRARERHGSLCGRPLPALILMGTVPRGTAPALPLVDLHRLPKHVAIIMDGNGRWAQSLGRGRTSGHEEGSRAVRRVVRAARRLGIEALTLYAFSEQNWCRPALEVTALMELLRDYLTS